MTCKYATDFAARFARSVDSMAYLCFDCSKQHEFWPSDYEPTYERNVGRNDGEAIALMHSELSELLEAVRDVTVKPSQKIPKFTQLEEEAADLLIRLLDYAHGRRIRLGDAVLAKFEYNLSRPKKHGRAL